MTKCVLTCGDPAGIGPEVIRDWWHNNPEQRHAVAVIGPLSWLESLDTISDVQALPVGHKYFKIQPGSPSKESATLALDALHVAADACKNGLFDAAVTGPISKTFMQSINFPFPGQTEFFAHQWGGSPTMAFVGDNITVALVTWHIPLAAVPSQLTQVSLTHTIHQAASLAKALGASQPKIAVCGLNPHAGEQGLIGHEEILFAPWLEALRETYPNLSNPLSADSLFHRHRQGEFDIVVALYHDQGLVPLKTLDFHNAVNITLGLPHIRTSPAHGTAFSLAGKNTANSQSLSKAIDLANRLSSCNVALQPQV